MIQSHVLGKEWASYIELSHERPNCFRQSAELEIVFDEQLVADFQETHGVTIGVVYRSAFNTLIVDLVRSSSGRLFAYERLIATSTGSGVVIVPKWKEKYLLLRQFRHAMRGYQLAFPRGFGEDGLTAVENAQKELLEELGARAMGSISLGQVVANSGISGDRVGVFLCELDSYEQKVGYEEIVSVVPLSEDELERQIRDGLIDDGFTLAAWALLQSKGVSGCR